MKNKLFLLIFIVFASLFLHKYNKQSTKKDKVPLQQIDIQIKFAIKQNRIKDAIEYAEQALKSYPEKLSYHILLTQLYQRKGEFTKALSSLEKVLVTNPQPDYLLLKGYIWKYQHHYSKALALFESLKQKNFIPAYLAIAETYIAQYELQKAKENLDALPASDKPYGDLLLLRAKLSILNGNYQLAQELLEDFNKIYPNIYTSHLLLIRVFILQGKIEKAKKYYSEKCNNPKKAYYALYQSLYSHLLTPTDAILNYIKNRPEAGIKNIHILQKMLFLNEYKKVHDFGSKFLKLAKNEISKIKVQSIIGHAYLQEKKYPEAEQIFSSFKKQNLHQYSKDMILCKIAQEELIAATKIYEEMPKEKNKKELIRSQIVKNKILYQQEKFTKIIEESKKLEVMMSVGMSEYALILETIARSYLALEKYSEATEYFKKIYTNKTSMPQLLLTSRIWHGVSLFLANKEKEAIDIWKKTQDINWGKYLTDTRQTQISLLSNKVNINSLSNHQKNDALFLEGLHQDSLGNKEKANTYYKKALIESIAKEFPFKIIQNVLKNRSQE